jgi:hypothetical protein
MTEPIRDVYTNYSGVASPQTPLSIGNEMLRANGKMSYREFIALVKLLWERAHPDVPIRPTQSGAFAKYPVITYSLELRKPHPAEPKKRYREELVDDDGSIYSIYGQRHMNVISFSAITKNDPELAEAIIEQFELFMDEYTGVLKELGASEILYSRRMSDREQERVNEDVSIRTVAYTVTLERLQFIIEEKLESILIDIRVFLDNQRVPGFEVSDDQVGTDQIIITQNNTIFEIGDVFILKSIDNLFYKFPAGVKTGHPYVVTAFSQDDSATPFRLLASIREQNGDPVTFLTTGKGQLLHSTLDDIEVNIIDQLAEGATPST